ncbi:unnamed protein product [Brugia pahangi]|uniref:LAM_G_DOMAIN domain-containing protein n=1 Tax=Brugia pahangi TaxID=6280 RepID=A0A0N4TRH8_BRUPA|nr:unnamed protein product [Brugia pahangi]
MVLFPVLNLLPYLLHHCYGGSYVAASSKSYGTYLRMWVTQLKPISSSYKRSISNFLGWTGKKVFMIAYSASGSVILKIDAGGRVMAVDFHNLPYGFLNFTLISPERGEEAFGIIETSSTT